MISILRRAVIISVICLNFDKVNYPAKCAMIAVHCYLDAFLVTHILDDIAEMRDGPGVLQPLARQQGHLLVLPTVFLLCCLCFDDDPHILAIHFVGIRHLLLALSWRTT